MTKGQNHSIGSKCWCAILLPTLVFLGIISCPSEGNHRRLTEIMRSVGPLLKSLSSLVSATLLCRQLRN